ncbi:hypothetical protein BGZ83_004465 [Gryganskiella cystojenkinii]|nr:hypothetical protein BGZ83_004465 [Gryganskiella cystojenkinii]
MELVQLLNSNPAAHDEVQGFDQYWVYNAFPGVFGKCLAVNKTSETTNLIDCSTQLATVCKNGAKRRDLLQKDLTRQIRIDTPIGQVQGYRDQNAFRFVGIPYAEPPTGDRRFAKPVPKSRFVSVWDATSYGHSCPQMSLLPDRHQKRGFWDTFLSDLANVATEGEDCLHLNVHTPSLKSAHRSGLPVIVFVHGGGYTSFAGSTILFEPGHLVARGGVIVVTLNYRLGFLGWLENTNAWDRSTIPGNQAIHDVILALEWVQSNIASFGGDPSRVTVMGESVGAVSIRALLSAPSSRHLYQNVISESDPIGLPFKPAVIAAQEANYFMAALGCTPNNLTCARAASIEDLIAARLSAFDSALSDTPWVTFGLLFRPVIDGNLIAEDFSKLVQKGHHNTQANILWGTMHDEAGEYTVPLWHDPVPVENASLALQELFSQNQVSIIMNSTFFPMHSSQPDIFRTTATRLGTDYFWLCPLRQLSRGASQFKRTFNFRFNRGRSLPLVGDPYCGSDTGRVCHSMGLQSTLGSGDAVPGFVQNGEDAQFARQVMDRFTSFVKTGDPNPRPGQVGFEFSNPDVTSVEWEPYNENSRDKSPILELNVASKMSYNVEFDVCDWMDKDFQYDFQIHDPANYSSKHIDSRIALKEMICKGRLTELRLGDQRKGFETDGNEEPEMEQWNDEVHLDDADE